MKPGNHTEGDAAATPQNESVLVAAHKANRPAREYPPMIYVLQGSFISFIISVSVSAAPLPKPSFPKAAGATQGDRSVFQFLTLTAMRPNS